MLLDRYRRGELSTERAKGGGNRRNPLGYVGADTIEMPVYDVMPYDTEQHEDRVGHRMSDRPARGRQLPGMLIKTSHIALLDWAERHAFVANEQVVLHIDGGVGMVRCPDDQLALRVNTIRIH